MGYKILKRIQNGQSTVGYQLLSEDNKILNVSKDQVMQAAYQGLIVNAAYNKHTKSLSGKNGTNLRKLHSIQFGEIVCSKQTQSKSKNYIDLANRYEAKQRLTGELLKFKQLDEDKFELIEVLDKRSTGRIVIPSFITSIGAKENESNLDQYKSNIPFNMCRFTEIFIDNRPGVPFFADGLCLNMHSETLKITFRHPECVVSTQSMFWWCCNLKKLDVSRLNTSNVVNMKSMFGGCHKLEKLNIENFNTSKVQNMASMFYYCDSIERLNLGNFDTTNVRDFQAMFDGCTSLKSVDISSFRTTKATNMRIMFDSCWLLEDLDVSNFDTSNVKDMEGMFQGCSSLKKLDVSGFNTSKVRCMKQMFYGCSSLKKLDVSGFNTSKVRSMKQMFKGCYSLESLDLTNFNINTDAYGMLDEVDLEVVKGIEKFDFVSRAITNTLGGIS